MRTAIKYQYVVSYKTGETEKQNVERLEAARLFKQCLLRGESVCVPDGIHVDAYPILEEEIKENWEDQL